ncbi:hypothetical protein DFAR_3850017 [Desulfarculales bacterium]
MDDDQKKRVAIFRFGVISDFFARDYMERGERERLLRDKCAQQRQIPFSNPHQAVALHHPRIWVRFYRQGGSRLESLYPMGRNDRGGSRALDEDIVQAMWPACAGKTARCVIDYPHQRNDAPTLDLARRDPQGTHRLPLLVPEGRGKIERFFRWIQSLPDWIGSHQQAFQCFGGMTELIVIDKLKSVVSKAYRYEPDINPIYQEMAAHYVTAVLPARVRKPRDKAKAEVGGVQLVEKWILAALRKRTCFSLAESNQAIRGLLAQLNNRPFKKLPGSRRSMYESLDKSALKPLPATAYQYAQYKKAKVHIDYHVEVDRYYYSAPPNCWAISWTSATRSARWNASIRASGWPATVIFWGKEASPP